MRGSVRIKNSSDFKGRLHTLPLEYFTSLRSSIHDLESMLPTGLREIKNIHLNNHDFLVQFQVLSFINRYLYHVFNADLSFWK